MYEHNALGYWSGLALCLTKVRSSRACCPVTALIFFPIKFSFFIAEKIIFKLHGHVFAMEPVISALVDLPRLSFLPATNPQTNLVGPKSDKTFLACLCL